MKKKSIVNTLASCRKSAKMLLLLTVSLPIMDKVQAQDKKQLQLADRYFAGGEYVTAASLYGQYLHPVKSGKGNFPLHAKGVNSTPGQQTITRTQIELKQAESYRLAHYWTEALTLYEQIYKAEQPNNPEALYWAAVCQRSLGNIAAAEENINLFFTTAAASEYRELALKEKQTIEFIKIQIARPDTILYRINKVVTGANRSEGIYAPISSNSGGFLFTGTQKDSVSNAGLNPNHNRIFQSIIKGGMLEDIEAVNFDEIDTTMNQGTPSFSADGRFIYFTQWKKGVGHAKSQIYISSKTSNGWSTPTPLQSINTDGYNTQQPFCSADGQFLFFASDRPGGSGGLDIWYAPIHADGMIGEVVNAGASINTADNEQAPFYKSSGHHLVFASDRAPGMGGFDLYASVGEVSQWGKAVNMGFPVNSVRDDVYFFAGEKDNLLSGAYISSDRGDACCLTTYAVTRLPKKKMLSGLIQDCGTNEPLANTAIILKDGGGTIKTITTGEDGRYEFELASSANSYQLTLQKEAYNERNTGLSVASINEKDWLVDEHSNADICLDKKQVLKVENVVSVYFDFDKSALKEKAIAQLDSIYNHFLQDGKVNLEISGYTDGRGSEAYNKVLSDKRAKACADYLIAKGVAAERILFASFGACCPIEMELINGRDNPDGRALNRRALINIKK